MISCKFKGCEITFTQHAIARIKQRFENLEAIEIPNRAITRACSNVSDEEQYRVKTTLATLVCVRVSENNASVVTVLWST